MKTIFNSHFSIFNSSKGFTLIELLTVVGIIGILAGMLLQTIDPLTQVKKANDARRKSDLNQIQKALEAFYQDNGRYPRSTAAYLIVDASNKAVVWGNPWNPYMNILPSDPSPTNHYVYYTDSTGQAYYLYASLERGGKDPQACNTEGTACSQADGVDSRPGPAACGGTCNYGVSSPNVSP